MQLKLQKNIKYRAKALTLKPASKYLVFVWLCLLIMVGGIWQIHADTPMTDSKIPVYPGGLEVLKEAGPPAILSYHLKVSYPTPDVLSFYEQYFTSRGWEPSFETCQRRWYGSKKGAEGGEDIQRELFASWYHPHMGFNATLRIEHNKKGLQREDVFNVEIIQR